MGEGEVDLLPDETTKPVRRRKKKLYTSILQQMEFYFSDSNLSKDRFLSQLLAESPYVDIDIFLKFNKIRKLKCTVDDIRKAILKSEIIEVNEDNKISRKKPVKVKDNVDACTIYVENIKTDTTHEWLSDLFSEFGKVAYVSIPKYKQNKVNKGFAFVEFESEEGAKEALSFFESIDLKMPSDRDPEQLRSIATFEGDQDNAAVETETKNLNDNKRKLELDDEEAETKKKSKKDHDNSTSNEESEIKTTKRKHSLSDGDDETHEVKKTKITESESESTVEGEAEGKKKKKKSKRDKKKAIIKELGIQILSKKEWKKLRNKYLDLQKKKMKEFKTYLNKLRFSQKVTDKVYDSNVPKEEKQSKHKLEFSRGLVVKVKTEEPCTDVKKLKTELKSSAPDVKYVDIPFPGSQEFFLRFGTSEAATEFCSSKNIKLENTNVSEKSTLAGEEEENYWKRMEESRMAKFEKQNKKQRGRDKLLKKANKEENGASSSHVRFEDSTE